MEFFNVLAIQNKKYLDLDEVLRYLKEKVKEDKDKYEEIYQSFRILKSLAENNKTVVKCNL